MLTSRLTWLALVVLTGCLMLYDLNATEKALKDSREQYDALKTAHDQTVKVFEDYYAQQQEEAAIVAATDQRKVDMQTKAVAITEKVKSDVDAIRKNAPAPSVPGVAATVGVPAVVIRGLWDTYRNSVPNSGDVPTK